MERPDWRSLWLGSDPATRGGDSFAPRAWGLWVGALGLLLAYLAPFAWLGPDVPLLIHDNLDSNFVWYTILANSGMIGAPSDAVVPNLLGGIPRGAFSSEFDLQLWLYVGFDPLVAYALNQALLRIVALVGAFLLLRRYVIPGDEPHRYALQLGCALCFALLPFWPSGGLAIAGQPLALVAFLDLRAGRGRASDWAIVVLLPFYGSLVFATLFFLFALGSFLAIDAVLRRRLDPPLWCALVLHGVILVAVDYRLFASLLGDGSFVSHRAEFDPVLVPTAAAVRKAWTLLASGHYHAASLQSPVMWGAVGAAGVAAIRARELPRLWLCCLLGVGAIASFFGLWRWEGFEPVREVLALGMGFNAARFYTLLPLLWLSIFATSLGLVWRMGRGGPVLALGLLASQGVYAFLSSDAVVGARAHGISYDAFFAREQFEAIELEIGLPQDQYRVASLGLHPSIAQFNGFHTADGYYASYPLAQKHALRRVIRHELEASPDLERYFDGWGNRGYLFSAEIGKRFLDAATVVGRLERIRLDPQALGDLGVRYVISAVEIAAPERSGLRFRRTFEHDASAWTLHLYEASDELAWVRP